MRRIAFSVIATALTAALAAAAPPKPVPPKAEAKKTPPPPEAEVLANLLREQLGKGVPDPLTKSNQGWGNQKAVTVVNREREGLFRYRTEPVQELRNDGTWRRTEVRIPDASKLALAITELTYADDGKILATVAVACDRVDIKFEQQLWRNGHRWYAGETRAHCQAGLQLKCVVTPKAETKPGAVLPDVTLQVKATEAELFYGELVVDHTAGLDGEAAKKVGELAIRLVKAAKPDLEGDLLRKANAAIVKAAGTREVKIALDKLLSLKQK